ncbi:hypothetical protein [Bradyrhizobium septentrionale]|uniref:Uncharacterized protein n=1 Tax=Bradyrhizobium septentrionale TaxID=1404411 RepID=A0ABZ2NR80_9BRAD
MSDNKSARDNERYPLDVLKRHLDTPQLLPHENAKDFNQLFDSLEDYGKAQNSRDYLAVFQATVLTWDVLRYQHMKIGVLRSHERAALESLLCKIQVRMASPGLAEAIAKSDAGKLAAAWFDDSASRPAMMKMIENAGFPPNALEVEAFQLALPALATIERLIVSAQKRLDKFLDDLERASKANARALRLAAEKAIAVKASGQSQASMK